MAGRRWKKPDRLSGTSPLQAKLGDVRNVARPGLIPNALLSRYFQARGLFGDLNLSAMKVTQPDALFSARLTLPDARRNEMDAEFQDIFELSCEKGFRAILDEAACHLATDDDDARTAFVDKPASLSNHFERAMVTFLDHNQF